MVELKPCPFCGSNLLSFTHDGTATIVLCGDCSGMGPLGMDEETATLAWNIRGGVGLDELLEARNSQHVLKAEGESPDATDRENCANASPDGGPVGAGQAAAAAPLGMSLSAPAAYRYKLRGAGGTLLSAANPAKGQKDEHGIYVNGVYDVEPLYATNDVADES